MIGWNHALLQYRVETIWKVHTYRWQFVNLSATQNQQDTETHATPPLETHCDLYLVMYFLKEMKEHLWYHDYYFLQRKLHTFKWALWMMKRIGTSSWSEQYKTTAIDKRIVWVNTCKRVPLWLTIHRPKYGVIGFWASFMQWIKSFFKYTHLHLQLSWNLVLQHTEEDQFACNELSRHSILTLNK